MNISHAEFSAGRNRRAYHYKQGYRTLLVLGPYVIYWRMRNRAIDYHGDIAKQIESWNCPPSRLWWDRIGFWPLYQPKRVEAVYELLDALSHNFTTALHFPR